MGLHTLIKKENVLAKFIVKLKKKISLKYPQKCVYFMGNLAFILSREKKARVYVSQLEMDLPRWKHANILQKDHHLLNDC